MSSRRTGYAVIAAILLACAAAFARAEQLKLAHSPVTSPRMTKHFSPVCAENPPVPAACLRHATLSFKLRKPAGLSLTLVDSAGHTVFVFPQAVNRHPAGRVQVTWDGRTQSGALAPDGTYRLRVHLLTLGRTITIPTPLIVDTVKPVLTLRSRPGATPVRYRVSEPAHVFLAFNAGGHVTVLRGRNGRVRIPEPLRRRGGSMLMVAVDLAGNRSQTVSVGSLS